ncbi:MAG: zeta toxin family protein [Coriobacteriales bacterium]|jgi:UDP-N-acetylglucosamine kinase|nr:zeta toxin family protein [Coriobacteriales bacterium]
MAIEDYSEVDFQNALAAQVIRLTRHVSPCRSSSVAYLTGGQPGSGKAAFQGLSKTEQNGNLIIIEADAFRSLHPNYDVLAQQFGKDSVIKTQEFSGALAEALIMRLSDDGYNLLIEGTLRTTTVLRQTAGLLHSKGYTVELLIMAVKPIISYVSTIERYERMLAVNPETARATPKEHHDRVVKSLCPNLRELHAKGVFDTIRLYNRALKLLYSSVDTPNIDPSGVLRGVMDGSWAKEETDIVCHSIQEIYALMESRGIQGTDDWKTVEHLAAKIEAVLPPPSLRL